MGHSFAMSWFSDLVGVHEESPEQVRANLIVLDGRLSSRANGKAFQCGSLETPSLAELRARTASIRNRLPSPLTVSEIVADVRKLHQSPEADGALFQVASQFNLLEMTGPDVSPEHGVGIYEDDRTQGPACAIACGAATIFRNYFVEVDGQVGQSAHRQIDCLSDLGAMLGNTAGRLFTMRNGYALATAEGLGEIARSLDDLGDAERDALRAALRIGVHSGAGVTLGGSSNVVSQAFCSALPVAYSSLGADTWEPFARHILEGAYEATLHAALLNREETGSARVYLTLLGGGAFGNRREWILDAMERALRLMRNTGLDVEIVSYGSPSPGVRELAARSRRSETTG
jgi:hypothetical protein